MLAPEVLKNLWDTRANHFPGGSRMKHGIALLVLTLSSALAMTPPQTLPLKVGNVVSASERDTLTLERNSFTWKQGKSSLCPNITDPTSKIDCVRMGSMDLEFTQVTAGKTTKFTMIYGDGKRLEQTIGKYRLKVLGVDFPKPAEPGMTCPAEVELRVTLEKLR
jgi:hypothetical protein